MRKRRDCGRRSKADLFSMRSDLVVISWWSNCLGLACLHGLVRHTQNRAIYVVQVGKSAAQKERFRRYLPPGVQELPYPMRQPAEHGRAIKAVARRRLSGHAGLWFFDHDLFVFENLEPWLAAMDRDLEESGCCLCHLQPNAGPSLTCPAFWLSPMRLPEGLPGFEPVPYRPTAVSRRPDLYRVSADLIMPEKDTLVLAKEFLAERGLVGGFSLRSFPRHDHLGGLTLFTGGILPESFRAWMEERLAKFTSFYAACPQDWVAAEDPTLLRRLEEFRRAM